MKLLFPLLFLLPLISGASATEFFSTKDSALAAAHGKHVAWICSGKQKQWYIGRRGEQHCGSARSNSRVAQRGTSAGHGRPEVAGSNPVAAVSSSTERKVAQNDTRRSGLTDSRPLPPIQGGADTPAPAIVSALAYFPESTGPFAGLPDFGSLRRWEYIPSSTVIPKKREAVHVIPAAAPQVSKSNGSHWAWAIPVLILGGLGLCVTRYRRWSGGGCFADTKGWR